MMEGTQATAQLVEHGASLAAGGVGTTLPRTEIERVIAEAEFPVRLDLHVRRAGGRQDDAVVGVAWTEQELRDVLARIGDDEVTLLFDAEGLEHVLHEVEAHGMRERTAVLAVAIAAAGATGGSALAGPQPHASSARGAAATAAGSLSPDIVAVAPGSKYQVRPGQTVVTVGGEARTPAAGGADSAAPVGGGSDVVAVAPGARYEPLPGETVTTPAPASDAPQAFGGGDSSLSTGDDAAIAGGAALLIAAAGFAAAQSRRRPARPA